MRTSGLLLNLLPLISYFLEACELPSWPSADVVKSWKHHGASEKCFCAYTSYLSSGNLTELTLRCPLWKEFVSTDERFPDKLSAFGKVVIQGKVAEKIRMMPRVHFQSIIDWAIDFGTGYGNDCNRTADPFCREIGLHILSVPQDRYFTDCCSSKKSLYWFFAKNRACELLALLEDLIAGPLASISSSILNNYKSCNLENEDPTSQNKCMAQCFHIHPDVRFLHLHTTAGVKRIRDEPGDSGLGPDSNHNRKPIDVEYNLCVCEPESWKTKTRRGFCPKQQPYERDYVHFGAISLCKNLAGYFNLREDDFCNKICFNGSYDQNDSKTASMLRHEQKRFAK